MNLDEKVRENRLRRMAQRQGLRVVKSRRRDPRAIGFGCYYIVDIEMNCVGAGTEDYGRPNYSLDDVEEYLTGAPVKRPPKRKHGAEKRKGKRI